MSVNSAMIIEWGMPIEGREMKALEEFIVSMAYWGGLKASGKIADFRTYGTMTGDFARRSGMVILEGTEAQLSELRASEEFRTRLNHVITIGHNVAMTLLEMGDAMASRMQRYGSVVKGMLG